MKLLEIANLQIGFRRDGAPPVRVVDGVDLSVEAGEVLGLVGESGCGKTLTAMSIARLLPSRAVEILGGEIRLAGRDVWRLSRAELRQIRGGVVSYVFQQAGAALNPVMRVGAQIMESLRLHRPEAATEAEVIRLLRQVGIPAPETRARCYPHELSGGMQQRVMIAMAIAPRPKLLVADEPTTALDVTLQAQIIELLRELRRELGMSILLITHNLGLVGDLADRVAVMYAGQLVETAPAHELLKRPVHPYTRALLNSVPVLGRRQERLQAIPGVVPPPGAWPGGCRFHPRCPARQADCETTAPPFLELPGARQARCLYAREFLAGEAPARSAGT
jgi:oligopeptide/dipeptide ABC transporter ATP-binding protein